MNAEDECLQVSYRTIGTLVFGVILGTFMENGDFSGEATLPFVAHLSLLRVSFWDTAMSVVRVDVRDVRDICPSTF